jgi:hypothetical protein
MKVEYHCVREVSDDRSIGIVRCYRYSGEGNDAPTEQKQLTNIGLHSPDGFEMGYGGSGPADLALTILCDYFNVKADAEAFKGNNLNAGQKLAWGLHQQFKNRFIATQRDSLLISSEEIDSLVAGEVQLDVNIDEPIKPDEGVPN